jgi:hypothetical protein
MGFLFIFDCGAGVIGVEISPRFRFIENRMADFSEKSDVIRQLLEAC